MKSSATIRPSSLQRRDTPPAKRHVARWVRITSLALTLALAGSVAFGMPLHARDTSCTMTIALRDCEPMGMEPNAPGATAAPLCCLLNCQGQGPTSSSFSVQIPSFNVATAHQLVLPSLNVPKPLPQSQWLQSSSFTPPDTYLKNLALLI